MARIFAVHAVPTAAVIPTYSIPPVARFASLLLLVPLFLLTCQLHRSWRTCSCWTPDVPVLSCAAVGPAVAVVLSAVSVNSQLWLESRMLPLPPTAVDVLYPTDDYNVSGLPVVSLFLLLLKY
jgi:hypothetical protein